MIHKLKLTVLFVSGLILFAGCEKDYLLGEQEVEITEPVGFASQIQPILTASCATTTACHASGGNTPDLTEGIAYNELQAYVDTTNADGSELYLRVNSTEEGYRMPLNATDRLSNTEIGMILAWIKQGAQNN